MGVAPLEENKPSLVFWFFINYEDVSAAPPRASVSRPSRHATTPFTITLTVPRAN